MESKEVSILDLQRVARTWPLMLASILLFIHNTVMGLSFYYASVTLPYHQNGTHGYIQMTESEDTTYVSLHQLSMVLGSFLQHPLGEKFGRKKVLILANVLTILSFTLMYISSSFYVLLFGRCISGMSFGIGVLLPLVLISEIATIKHRPGMANSVNLAINFGGLLVYLVNMIFPPEHIALAVIAPSILFILCSPLLLESPHWLIRIGRMEEAERTFRALRGPEYRGVEREIKEVFAIVDRKNENIQRESRWKSRTFLIPMAILGVLFSTIGLCGLDAPLTLYGPRMFSEFNFFLPYQYVSLIIPIGGFIGYCVASPLLGCMKKKVQYVLFSLLMALASGLLGIAYFIKDIDGYSIHSQVLLGLGALGICFGYGCGLGAVIYCLPGELLSPEDKTIGLALAENFRLVWTAGVVKIYPVCLYLVGQSAMFGFHSLVLVLSAVFVLKYLPETKDKSLTELQNLFKKIPDAVAV